MHLDLTARCNLRCVHCYFPRRPASVEMRTSEWKRTLDRLAAAGTLFLTFSGGEVMLRPDFPAILRHAASLKFSVTVYTNGTMVDEETVEVFSGCHVRETGLSVYSMDPAVHDMMTGKPGSLARTVRAAELLSSLGAAVAVRTLVTRLNFKGCREIEAWAGSLGPRARWRYDLLVVPRYDRKSRELELNLTPAERTAFMLDARKSRGGYERMEGVDAAPRPRKAGEPVCYAGRTGAYIGPSGDVQPCLDWHVRCGNVRKEEFDRIWRESEGMVRARSLALGEMGECMKCGMLRFCTLCPGLNMQERGSAELPSNLVCGRTRALFLLRKGSRK